MAEWFANLADFDGVGTLLADAREKQRWKGANLAEIEVNILI